MVNGDSAKKGLAAFRRILELIQPVGDSKQIWLKINHNRFLVGDYTPDGHFAISETCLTDPDNPKSRILTKQHQDCWNYLSNWAKRNNGGVFYIPTQPQGLPIKDAVAVSDDIAAELDEGTIQEQWKKILEFVTISGLFAAFIIFSGSKSYHVHFKATSHLPIEQRTYLTQLLCIALSSDPAIANPHQPMRIAGFYRKEKGKEQTLEYSSDHRYTYEEFIAGFKAFFKAKGIPFPEEISEDKWRYYKGMRNKDEVDLSILDKPDDELYPAPKYSRNTPYPNISSTCSVRIPLDLALSRKNQEDLNGVASNRHLRGFEIACDLVGCNSDLLKRGYAVEGDPYELFINYCQCCSPGGGWNYREWSGIWRSANREERTPSRQDLSKFIHWYRWENDPDYKKAAIAEYKKNNPDPELGKEISKEEYEEKFTLPNIIKRFYSRAKKSIKKRIKELGYGKKNVRENPIVIEKPEYYQAEERIRTWNKSKKQFICDGSSTGTGKTYQCGLIKLSDYDATKLIYITNDPKNINCETLEEKYGWYVLCGRHKGLVVDRLGRVRCATGKEGEVLVVDPNCCRNETVKALGEKNIQDGNTSEVLCGGCSNYELCLSGKKYKNVDSGYLADRIFVLKQSKIIAHPGSLPNAEKFIEYGGSVLIWDEWSTILKNSKQITVWEEDLNKLIAHLVTEEATITPVILPLLKELVKLFKEKNRSRFGWNHHEIVERLEECIPKELEEEALKEATLPNLEPLNPTLEYGSNIQDMPKEVRKRMNQPDYVTAEAIRKETLKQWIIPLVKILKGETGYLNKSGKKLVITTIDNRLINIAKAAKKNIFLDATGYVGDLAKLLGIEVGEIDHVAAKQDPEKTAEVEYRQIIELGRLGKQRGKFQEKRANSIVEKIEKQYAGETRRITFKDLAKGNDLYWFGASRGANDAIKDKVLIIEGTPTPNLEALRAEFSCLYGKVPKSGSLKIKYNIKVTNKDLPEDPYIEITGSADPEFEAFVRRKILAEIHQAIGRLRANCREGEKLIIYIISNYPLDIPVELIKASSITPEAADKIENLEILMTQAVEQILGEGEKVTQTRVAKIIGYSQSYVSRFRGLLCSILNRILSKKKNSSLPEDIVTTPVSEKIEYLVEEYLPNAKGLDLPLQIYIMSSNLSEGEFLKVFDCLPQKVRKDLIYWLLAIQPTYIIEQIERIRS